MTKMRAEIEIKNLDHLGLVVGLIDELEIESIVNEALGIDRFEKVTAGQIVKGIIINGLDFRLFWFLCGNEIYTNSFFRKIVLKVLSGKDFAFYKQKLSHKVEKSRQICIFSAVKWNFINKNINALSTVKLSFTQWLILLLYLLPKV